MAHHLHSSSPSLSVYLSTVHSAERTKMLSCLHLKFSLKRPLQLRVITLEQREVLWKFMMIMALLAWNIWMTCFFLCLSDSVCKNRSREKHCFKLHTHTKKCCKAKKSHLIWTHGAVLSIRSLRLKTVTCMRCEKTRLCSAHFSQLTFSWLQPIWHLHSEN